MELEMKKAGCVGELTEYARVDSITSVVYVQRTSNGVLVAEGQPGPPCQVE